MKILCFFAVLFSGALARAYPEMIKHGYTKCSVCHFSVNGGDLLTAYGRELGREIFAPSTGAETVEENRGLIGRGPEWLRWGLNARLLQTYVDSSQVTRGRFMIMQADLDVAVAYSRLKAYASVGRYEPKNNQSEPNDFYYLPRMWLSFDFLEAGDAQLTLKAGRFYPSYGVMIPEHVYATRVFNAFGPGQERKAAELAWMTPNYEVIFTRVEGRMGFRQETEEKGAIGQIAFTPTQHLKFGANAYRSTLPGSRITAMDGAFVLAGWAEKWSTLVQVDRFYPGNGKSGALALLKLDYEWSPGFNIFVTEEYWSPDVEKTDPHYDALGLGLQYHFTPELELTTTARYEKNSAVLSEHSKVFWAILHWAPN